MKAIIPLSPENLGGPSIIVDANSFEVLADTDRVVIVKFRTFPPEIRWFERYDWIYCQRQHDGSTIKAIRKATDEDRRKFRVPLWIQGDEIPACCGRPMFFVGQIDDDVICAETPPEAKMWWHDAASFYVFTCSQCLECKVVGQQF